MASLINSTSSAQLGIAGDFSGFASGVQQGKKKVRKRSRAQAAAGQAANDTGEERLRNESSQKVTFDQKESDGANFQLTTGDEQFINKVKDLEGKLFSGQFKGAGGAKQDIAGFFDVAAGSSRGGMGDIWNDVIAGLSKGEVGPKKLAHLQESFTKAYAATNEVLNLDVDLGTYNFDSGGGPIASGKDLITKGKGGRKAFRTAKKATKNAAKAREGVSRGAKGTFAWDVGAAASDSLKVVPQRGSRRRGGRGR